MSSTSAAKQRLTLPGVDDINGIDPLAGSTRTRFPWVRLTPVARLFSILGIFYALTFVWFRLIFGQVRDILICCDATFAVQGSETFGAVGWLAHVNLEGYRSINTYAVTYVIRQIGFLFTSGPVALYAQPGVSVDAPYAVGSAVLFLLIGTVFATVFWRWKGFTPAFAAIFLNPVSIGVLPTPLQESQMVLIVAPLMLAAYLLLKNGKRDLAVVVLAALAGASWMVKPSFGPAMAATWVLIAYLVLTAPRKARRLGAAVIGAAAFLIIISPQVHFSLDRYGVMNPYANGDIFWRQLSWGNEMWHYETIIRAGEEPRGDARVFKTGNPHVEPGDYFRYLVENPLTAMALAGGHLIAAFDYTHMTTYITDLGRQTFSPINIVIGFIISAALFKWLRVITTRRYYADSALLDVFLFTTLGPLLIVAVETRFGIVAMLVLTLRAVAWARDPTPGATRITEASMSLIFGLFYASAVAILASTVSGSSPG